MSALGAAVWLVHTVQTQSVSYVYQRFTCLAAFFFLLSIYAFLKARLGSGRPNALFYAGTVAAGILAVGSKENAATLPLILLLIDWLLIRDKAPWLNRSVAATSLLLLLRFLAVSFYFLGSNFLAMMESDYERRGITLVERLLTETRVVVFYMSLLVYPHPSRLRLDYDFSLSRSLLSPPTTLLSLIVIFAAVGVALYRWRKNRFLSFAILWFFGNLIIESSFVPLDLVYEHRLYIPSMAPLLLLSGFYLRSVWSWRHRWITGLPMAVVVVTLGLWTVQRNRVWSDPVALWQDNVAKSPYKARVHANLARAYLDRGQWAPAQAHLEQAIRLDPSTLEARTLLGNLYLDHLGDLERAGVHFRQVLAIQPENAAALVGSGVVLLRRGEPLLAADLFEEILEREPWNHEALLNLASSYFNLGDYRETITVTRAALRYWPTDARIYALLGAAYQEVEEEELAKSALDKALEIDPQNQLARRRRER